jgi:hypothetical protein
VVSFGCDCDSLLYLPFDILRVAIQFDRCATLTDTALLLYSRTGSALVMIGSEQMKRVDLYIKVTVEVDQEEKPERIAGEICRQMEKLYGVRSAELSNIVSRD